VVRHTDYKEDRGARNTNIIRCSRTDAHTHAHTWKKKPKQTFVQTAHKDKDWGEKKKVRFLNSYGSFLPFLALFEGSSSTSTRHLAWLISLTGCRQNADVHKK
jgi:hypothetical protein